MYVCVCMQVCMVLGGLIYGTRREGGWVSGWVRRCVGGETGVVASR